MMAELKYAREDLVIMKKTLGLMVVAMLLISLAVGSAAGASIGGDPKDFKNIRIRFFVGGDPGDAFGSIVYKGAKDAEKTLGVKVDYVFSGWNVERFVAQFRDAVAARPDAICMMGHPGDDALMPIAERAYNEGIVMMYQNVDVPKVRERFGGGYVGADQVAQGRALAMKALSTLGLAKGDRVAIFGPWGKPGRAIREGSVADTFAKAGLVVDKLSNPEGVNSSPELLIPLVTGQLLAHPETKVMVFSGGQLLGAVPRYMEAAGKKPGEVKCIGFDLSPGVLEAFKKGYVQISSDQQPYLQGYLPILSAAFTKAYGFSPISYDTSAGLVTKDNYRQFESLVKAGIR